MSVTFSTGFHQIKPGLRVSGDEISVVFVGTYDSGLYAGKKYIHIDLTNETDLTFVEAGVSGPLETVADVDALYTQLKDAGMTEAFDGFLIDPSDLSSISISDQQVSFDFAGHQAYVFSRNPDAAVTTRTKVAHQTWSLPQTEFVGAVTLFGALESPEEVEFVSIENRLGLLEATNGLIKDDYNFITLVGTPSPAAGQVGVTSTVPSLIDMIVLPTTDVDGKILEYSSFKAGDRIGLKQANGSAAIYSLDPSSDMGTHFRFNAELLTLGYYGDQPFVFDTGVTAVIEDTSTRTSAAAVMGVDVSALDLGTFSGATIADGSTAKAALQALESGLESVIDSGVWLFADQASFPSAADNHGRVVHSHADGAMFYAHGGMWHQLSKEVDLQTAIASIDSEATAREAADTAFSGRLDVLEADPTTATAVAAGDAATLSSATTYTDTAISNVIGSAPGVLDTLGEIADAINDDANVYTTLVSQVNAVQSDVDSNEIASDAADAALSGRLDTLEVDPTTAAAVQAVQDNLDTEAGTRAAADSALDGRLDVLEADPTTATAVAAVQSDVDANQTSSEAADTALSGRLDVLEADPTTATAVAAVQADVDQNEADADTALALKAPLADPDFTGQLEVDTNARIEFADNLTKVHNVLRGTSIAVGNNIQLNPAAADGRVEIEGGLYLRPSDMVDASNDAQAAAAGVVVGELYRSGSILHIRVS